MLVGLVHALLGISRTLALYNGKVHLKRECYVQYWNTKLLKTITHSSETVLLSKIEVVYSKIVTRLSYCTVTVLGHKYCGNNVIGTFIDLYSCTVNNTEQVF